jgi:signal transduction histidine kinase
MKNLLQKYYLKIRIILTFCVVTFILVLIMSRISYQYTRQIYLDQISQHARAITGIIAKQIDTSYLDLLQLGTPGKTISDYFRNLVNKYENKSEQSEFFLFDDSFKILLHSSQTKSISNSDPELYLNQTEILNLTKQSTTSTLPFRGDDGNWYLWAFYRLNDNLWLGMQESAYQLKKVEELSLLFWYIGIAGIFVTLILGFFVATSITKPIDRLTIFSTDIGKGNFNLSPPKKMKGELKILSDAMDKMRLDILNNHKEKEEMLAQIAHEIRNPLGSIELMANLTKEDILSGKNNVDYLNKILLEISDLKSLITAYLNYSRPYLAKPEKIDLNKLFEEIFSLFKEELTNKNIQFDRNLLNDKVVFDPGHLKQIFINLISNSIEAIGENGSIQLVSENTDNYVLLKISDTGNGISAENINNIFNPFFTTKKNGTGLGLAICRKLCHQNNAQIEVSSNPESGCEFVITKRNQNHA